MSSEQFEYFKKIIKYPNIDSSVEIRETDQHEYGQYYIRSFYNLALLQEAPKEEGAIHIPPIPLVLSDLGKEFLECTKLESDASISNLNHTTENK